MIHPGAEGELFERSTRPGAGSAFHVEYVLDVSARRERAEEVERLEDEADLLAPHAGTAF